MYFKLAWRNIWRNKRRTIITVSSIAFAVFFSCVMQSMQYGSYERMIDNAVRFYTGYIQVHDSGFWEDRTLDRSFELNEQVLSMVKGLEEVEEAVPRLESFALASYGTQTKGAMVLGIDPETETSLTNLESKLQEGEYLSDEDKEVLVSEGLAEYLKIGTGDTLVLIGQGYHGVNAAGKYHVKGIVKFPAPDLNNQLVYLPLAEAQWLYGAEDLITSLALVVQDADWVDRTVEKIKTQLDESDYEVMGWEEMLPELVQGIELDYVSGLVFLVILYAVIAFGIFGTFLMMTNERRYELGIMMAIGMKRQQLARIMASEILLLAFWGVVVGILISLPIIIYYHYNPIPIGGEYREMIEKFGIEAVLPFSMDLAIFRQQSLIVFFISAVLGLYPMAYIFNLNLVRAIRD